jgi:integrase
MNATMEQLALLQKNIAAGRPVPLPGNKADEFYWHPTMPGFALRVYRNGTGTWLIQYRNKRGLQHRYKLGVAAALSLKEATTAATIAFGDIARGQDPQADLTATREKPKHTLGAIARQFLDDGTGYKGKRLSPKTLKMYGSIFKNHLGALAKMQVDEIDCKDISEKTTLLNSSVSAHIANHTKAFIGSCYRWGRSRGIITVPSPVSGTWTAELPESRARSLSYEELGAIWRACEDLAASPERYKGNAWGANMPDPANSVRADDALLTRTEAARQSGFDKSILWRAIQEGDLKVEGTRRDLQIEDHPLKIRQGYHRRTLLISQKELERFTASRLGMMRSPQAEYAAIIRLLMLLGGRYSEIAELRWSEIDLDKGLLHIKGKGTDDRRGTKNKRDLKLPIPAMAVDILKNIKPRPGRDFIFGDGPRGLLNNSRHKDELDDCIAKTNGGKALAPWRHHDLRHSLTTLMNEQGIDPRIVETIVNHRGGIPLVGGERTVGHKAGIAGKYNHAEYRDPVTLALDWWSRKIRAVADGATEQPDSNVVVFKGIAS